MINIAWRSFAMIVCVAVASLTVSAQITNRVPREVPIEKKVEKAFSKYFIPKPEYPLLLSAKFYPIGFSRDGKFAYVIEPVDEACGCYFANIVIQDLRTDKILWELDFDQGKLMDEKGKMPPIDTLPRLWRNRSKLINAKLREHKIIPGSFTMLPTAFESGGSSFAINSTSERKDDEDGNSRITNATVSISSSVLGSKSVFSGDYDKDLFMNPLDAAVIGAIKSPFEKRIAILFIQVARGYEGPPHTGDIRIVGADLKSGFEKR